MKICKKKIENTDTSSYPGSTFEQSAYLFVCIADATFKKVAIREYVLVLVLLLKPKTLLKLEQPLDLSAMR